MTDAEIYNALTEIFDEVFMEQNIVPRSELSAKDVSGWDSFKQIEIVIATEERFGIHLTTRELDTLQNVGDLVRIIAQRTGGGRPEGG
jgi:acyl carrier protein